MNSDFDVAALHEDGFVIRPSVLSPQEVAALIALLEANITKQAGRGGTRDVMKTVPALTSITSHPNVRGIVEKVLGPGAFPVRATLFDKTDAANWKVPWHQDVTIAVQERCEIEGFGPWSIKAGVQHVQPPTSVLDRMLTVRIHLDPCSSSNGALRVIPGTHQLGRLDQNRVAPFAKEEFAVTCEAEAVDALLMRPLLLHTSSPSLIPAHRRVLHFDSATDELANGITWHMGS